MDIYRGILLFGFLTAVSAKTLVEHSPTTAFRVVNGTAVDIKEIPYQASLRRKAGTNWSHICGAVIITTKSLLTAGHCVNENINQPSSFRVVVGTSSKISGGKNYDVFRMILHEEYVDSNFWNDIAMLFVSKDISFDLNTLPIPWASSSYDLKAGSEALVSGFGSVEFDGASSTNLLAAKVNIISQEECAKAYLGVASITSGMVCASGVNPSRDACQGDSGGPLVVQDTLVGLISWGYQCALPEYPGIYTRVSYYETWIFMNLEYNK